MPNENESYVVECLSCRASVLMIQKQTFASLHLALLAGRLDEVLNVAITYNGSQVANVVRVSGPGDSHVSPELPEFIDKSSSEKLPEEVNVS